MGYPSLYDAKEMILDVGKRMYEKGFVAANDGNITCRLSDDMILATPTGVSKGHMKADTMVKMSMDGEVISMGDLKPSSEIKMHLRVYKENPEVMAVVHAHPPVSASFAIAGISLDQAIMPEAVVNLGIVPIAKYANPGTVEVPDSIAPFCRDYNAVLLANHGALTWGKDLMEAYFRMESLEYYATVMMYTGNIIGRSNILSCDQIQQLMQTREQLGITAGGVPPCAIEPSNTRDVVPGGGTAGGFSCGDSCRGDEDISAIIARVTAEVLKKLG